MKKKFFWLVLSLMTLFLVACGGGEKKEETTDSANANTEISGKIVIYTSMYEDIIDNVSEKLKKEFPNLEVEFFQGGTGTLQSKIIAELQANKLGCDMLMVAEPSYSLELKEKGMWVVGTDLETDNMYTKTNLTGDMAVVIGNEEKGISRLVKEECDILVKIPMIGKVQSLNVSVSAGIIIYEIVRQRLEKKQ